MASLFIHSLTHFTFTINFGESYLVPRQRRPAPCGAGIAGGGGRWREDMASGGEGFGTEGARLGRDALGTERARLAQGGFRGQFSKRNPFLKKSLKTCKILHGYTPVNSKTFVHKIPKIQIPMRNFFFVGWVQPSNVS